MSCGRDIIFNAYVVQGWHVWLLVVCSALVTLLIDEAIKARLAAIAARVQWRQEQIAAVESVRQEVRELRIHLRDTHALLSHTHHAITVLTHQSKSHHRCTSLLP